MLAFVGTSLSKNWVFSFSPWTPCFVCLRKGESKGLLCLWTTCLFLKREKQGVALPKKGRRVKSTHLCFWPSTHFLSSSSFLRYAEVMNLSLPSNRWSSCCRSLSIRRSNRTSCVCMSVNVGVCVDVNVYVCVLVWMRVYVQMCVLVYVSAVHTRHPSYVRTCHERAAKTGLELRVESVSQNNGRDDQTNIYIIYGVDQNRIHTVCKETFLSCWQ